MNYFTTDLYETKREIVIFSDKLASGLSKPEYKFVIDMMFGLSRSQSVLLSDIARSLDENIKLRYTIERLSSHLENMNDHEIAILRNNYNKLVLKNIDKEPLVLLDDSEIIKKYGKKFEDLCMVRDASSLKDDIYPGYHVCEATVVTKNEKQPISLYSHIYSSESSGFKSMNDETLKSIEYVKSVIEGRCTFVCDRGYDANIYYDYFIDKNENEDDFVIRLKENRILLFKGKAKKVGEIAQRRKGKVKMKMYFSKGDAEVNVSHTRVELPRHKGKTLYLVIIYGLSEEKPMMLLTNKVIKNKKDVHKIVRAYMSRWRIEENFRFKKQQYGFENMRVRKLKAMNTLNMMLMMHIGHIGMLAEKVDKKLLVIKMIERGKSIKGRTYLWYYQISRGIKEILKYAHKGIKEFQGIREKKEYVQLELKL